MYVKNKLKFKNFQERIFSRLSEKWCTIVRKKIVNKRYQFIFLCFLKISFDVSYDLRLRKKK